MAVLGGVAVVLGGVLLWLYISASMAARDIVSSDDLAAEAHRIHDLSRRIGRRVCAQRRLNRGIASQGEQVADLSNVGAAANRANLKEAYVLAERA
jgi:hypothetical protein